MASNSVSIPVLSGSSSRDEEFAFLDKVAKAAGGENTYLGQLFSVSLVSWLREQIRNDFDCDLYERYATSDEARLSLQDALRDSELARVAAEKFSAEQTEKVERFRGSMVDAQREIDRVGNLLNASDALRETLSFQLGEAQNEIEAWRKKLMLTQDEVLARDISIRKLVENADGAAAVHRHEVGILEDEISRLKCLIFDAEHPGFPGIK